MAGKKILVADDDPKILNLLLLCLAKEGYEVTGASDAYQAMQAAVEQVPDLLLLDINMPAGNGLSVQERLQKVGSLCAKPVIYLTGDKSRSVQMAAKRMGAFALLYKPFEIDRLRRTVRAALHTPDDRRDDTEQSASTEWIIPAETFTERGFDERQNTDR
jgi:two-component system response regulator MprA